MGQLEIITQDKMQEILDFSYNQAINGVSQFNSAQELAQEYLNKDGTLEEQINSLIKAQNIKAATSGFITSLGGIVTLPANITSIFMIQMRMIATIAYMCGADIKDEFYLSVVLDRKLEMPLIMASTEGGMNIEDVAANTPEKIVKVPVDPSIGFQGFHGRELAFGLGITDKAEQKNIITFAQKLFKVYTEMLER